MQPRSSFTTHRRQEAIQSRRSETGREPRALKRKWPGKGPQSNIIIWQNFWCRLPENELCYQYLQKRYIDKQLAETLRKLYCWKKKKNNPSLAHKDLQLLHPKAIPESKSLLPTRKELLRLLQGNPPWSTSQRWPTQDTQQGKLPRQIILR